MANALLDKFLAMKKEELCVKVKEALAPFDKDNTGFIKCEDVGKVVRSLGLNLTDDEVKDAIDVLDFAESGAVEFYDFLNFLTPKLKDDDPGEDLKAAFKFFDRDEDGFISAAELSDALASLGDAVTDEEANTIVKRADLDGDGKVSYEAFKKMMK